MITRTYVARLVVFGFASALSAVTALALGVGLVAALVIVAATDVAVLAAWFLGYAEGGAEKNA